MLSAKHREIEISNKDWIDMVSSKSLLMLHFVDVTATALHPLTESLPLENQLLIK